MSDIVDRIIKDLIKGAEASQGFVPGSKVNVELSRDQSGREEKLAAEASTYLGGVPFVGPGLAGLNAAAHDQSMGSGLLTAGGSGAGQASGAMLGGYLGKRLSDYLTNRFDLRSEDADLLKASLMGLGGTAGSSLLGALGAAGGRTLAEPVTKNGSLNNAYVKGAEDALTRMGLKRANMLNSFSGFAGPLLRHGASKISPGVAKAMAHPAIGMGVDMAAQHLADRATS